MDREKPSRESTRRSRSPSTSSRTHQGSNNRLFYHLPDERSPRTNCSGLPASELQPQTPLNNMNGSPAISHSRINSSYSATNPSRSQHYPTNVLCSRALFHQMMKDYLEYLYPLIPVVHRPSFLKDLSRDRDVHDKDFLGLVVSICAVTVGTMPSRFREYSVHDPPIPFLNRREMINSCYNIITSLRGPGFFDELNYQKWAVSYLMQISFFQIGEHNRARMVEVEGMQLARLLDLHQISRYDGLNCIETQLRKKAFWLMFYGYV